MYDPDNGNYLENIPLLINPDILSNNGLDKINDEIWDEPEWSNPTTDTTATQNYRNLTVNGENYSLVPRDFDKLYEIDNYNDYDPTYMKLNDIKTSDPLTYAFLSAIVSNETTLKDYKTQLNMTGNNQYDLLQYESEYYIDTVKHKDLGLTDTFVDSAFSTLNANNAASQTFKDVSKWSFDIGANVFYQYRIYDWFVRAGVFGNFPVANKTVSLMENTDKTNNSNDKTKSSDNNLSLEHSFDVGVQILGGYNISQNLSAVFGVEFGYTKWILNNLDKLASKYSLENSILKNWIKSSDEYNKSLEDIGLSSKEKKLGKWFWRGVVGLEYNISNFIIALQAYFGPGIKLMKQSNKTDFGDVTVSNMGLRLNLAFKF